MSANDAPGARAGGGGRGFTPPRLTLDQFREFANFFRDLLRDNPVIKWSIVLAGIGGVFEAVHDTWLFLVWVYWKIR